MKTQRMDWTYPNQEQDPWYEAFSDLINQIANSAYASREDRNLIVMGGGTVAFNSGTGVLSWSSDIEIGVAQTGFLWKVVAGNITLNEGQFAYTQIVRGPTDTVTLTLSTATQLPSTVDGDRFLIFAVRRGSRVYFRNGDVINNGESLAIFQSNASSNVSFGAAGEVLRNDLTLTTNEATDQGTYQVVGAFQIDPDDYALTNTTLSVDLVAVGAVTNAAATGEVLLRNATDSVDIDTLTFTGSTATSRQAATVTLNANSKLYEIRIRITGGAPGDQIFCYWAGLQINRTIN